MVADTMNRIEKIEDLLKKHLGENKNIVNIKSENLVAPGENFGGELLRLEVTARDEKEGSEEIFHAVAKKIPLNEAAQKIFNIQQTFKGEINFYDKIVPTLQNFQRKYGVQNVIDCFPKLYGARINLDEENSDVVDENAVIVLENLHTSGYANVDRHVGYDLESAELLLRDLAALHAVPLAMKLREPEFFEGHVRQHCVNALDMRELQKGDPDNLFSLITLDTLWESDKCSPFIQKVKNIFLASRKSEPVIREPFATFAHEDLWVNNAMIKYVNGRPEANKFVDFQVYTYKSPASDLLFFLFTSVQQEVLQKHLESLIKLYHTEFIRNLNELGCDSSPFIMSKFREELAIESKSTLVHILTFLPMVVFGEKNKAPEPPSPSEQQPPDFASTTFRDEIRKNIHSKAKEKLWFTVQVFGKKGWL